jgi:deoxyribodipyrimidine photo-lyase
LVQKRLALQQALDSGLPVLPVFIFDTNILNNLEDKADRRLDYIQQALAKIHQQLSEYQSGVQTFLGTPLAVFKELSASYDIEAIYCNRDYEPTAIARDEVIKEWAIEQNIGFYDFKDQVIFDKFEITKDNKSPYTVYTPYSKKWLNTLKSKDYSSQKTDFSQFVKANFKDIHSLENIGFKKTDLIFQTPTLDAAIIDKYDKYRDFPAMQHTTQLSTALRFGTISIRKCVAFALKHNTTWLGELIWREFFMQILFHFPKVVHSSFKPQFEYIKWRNNEAEFELWCQGKTGYPIVDAGMRQLNQTGFMHNRVRMVVASFLCKHLLIDWRWGEAYFATKLNDYDLSANNGNWQWAAGSGCDAAPYFRIFNPTLQTQRFDKDLQYIKKWVPEFESLDYIHPIVEHKEARERALRVYGESVET